MRSLIHPLKSIAKSLRTSDSPLAAPWAWFLSILLAVGLLLRSVRVSFNHGPYDHDVDTWLYMAWRLLEGNLLFIDHYNAKFPIVQYLHVPSFLVGGILGHRLITLAVTTATSLLFYKCLLSLQRLGFFSRQISRTWMVLCSALLLCLSQLHPGGLSGHLHLFANGFLVLALWMLLKSLMVNSEQSQRAIVWQFLGGGSLAWAIQIRPNLLVSVGCCGLIWLMIRWLQRRWERKEESTICRLALGAALFSLPFILPYLAHPDGLALLKIGSWDLLHQWNSEQDAIRHRLGLLELLKAIYWDRAFEDPAFVNFTPYGLLVLPIPILLLLNLRAIRPRSWAPTTWIPLLSSIFIVALWFSFLKTHFWSHYVLLEVVPITLLFAWIPAGLAQSRVPQALWEALQIGFTSIVMIVGGVMIFASPSTEHSATAKAQQLVVQHLRSLPPGQHFFAPGDPSFHWKLQEPMPVKGIHSAWMFHHAMFLSPSAATQRMGIATSPTETCGQLLAKPTDIIIWVESKAPLHILQSCFAASEGVWHDLTEEWGVEGTGYHVFRRSS